MTGCVQDRCSLININFPAPPQMCIRYSHSTQSFLPSTTALIEVSHGHTHARQTPATKSSPTSSDDCRPLMFKLTNNSSTESRYAATMDALVEHVDESSPTHHRPVRPIGVFGMINVRARTRDYASVTPTSLPANNNGPAKALSDANLRGRRYTCSTEN